MPVDRDALLPANATAFEYAQSQTSARILDADIGIIARERSPSESDAPFSYLLAWERSVHHWVGNGDSGDRARITSSFGDHLAYGSPAALEAEISLDVAYSVVIKDFFQAGLSWPQFLVEVPVVDDGAPPPTASAVWQSAIRRKNVRDYPVIRFVARETGRLYVGAQLRVSARVHILPADPWPRVPGSVFYGAGLTLRGTYRVRPFA